VWLLTRVCLTLQLADQEAAPSSRHTTGSEEALVELYTDDSVPPTLKPRSPTMPMQESGLGSGSGSGSGSLSKSGSGSELGNEGMAKSLSLMYSVSHSFAEAGNGYRATTDAGPPTVKEKAELYLSPRPVVSAHIK
jgi:hypothetical protein